jgi:hypothetical protein
LRPFDHRSQLSGIRGHDDELLPEAIRVLARELPRERVEAGHPLHRHEERFIGGEPRVDQHGYLLAKTVFQLRYVDRVDRLSAAEVAPPLVNLLLERYRRLLMFTLLHKVFSEQHCASKKESPDGKPCFKTRSETLWRCHLAQSLWFRTLTLLNKAFFRAKLPTLGVETGSF